jgi:4-amino-4-deoxy-L-arabinose transferase-like glycosyltransferase
MEVNTEIPSSKSISSFLIFGIFILAFAIRIYHIDSPPLDFEPERQYHSFILARNYFLQSSDSAPEWRKKLWQEAAAEEYVREPPILEHAVAWIYRITGKEQFWISRSLSVIFWLAGGWVLFRLLKNLVGQEAATFSLIFYLYNPFGIVASRAFMPDPLMILIALLAISCFVRYQSDASRLSLLLSAIFTGIASLIKPFCLIPLLTTFILLTFETHGRSIRSGVASLLWFLAIVGITTLPYYLAGLLPETGFLRGYSSVSIMPRLWFKPYFWGGWFDLIRMTAGYIPFIMGLIGILLTDKGILRSLLLGLWLGYLFFCLLFTYHIHTHDYYHLILIPVIAMSLAPIGSAVFKMMRLQNNNRIFRWIFTGILIFGAAASVHETRSRWKAVQYYVRTEVTSALEIGKILNHSSDVISLASYYAKPLKYHAEIGGKRWPYTYDFRANEIIGLENKPAQLRLQEDMKAFPLKYFVASDLEELNRQQDLKKLLYDNFPVFKETKNYVIFSLTPVTR